MSNLINFFLCNMACICFNCQVTPWSDSAKAAQELQRNPAALLHLTLTPRVHTQLTVAAGSSLSSWESVQACRAFPWQRDQEDASCAISSAKILKNIPELAGAARTAADRRVMFCCLTWQQRTATCIGPAPLQKSQSPSSKYCLREKAFRRERQNCRVGDNTNNLCYTSGRGHSLLIKSLG